MAGKDFSVHMINRLCFCISGHKCVSKPVRWPCLGILEILEVKQDEVIYLQILV